MNKLNNQSPHFISLYHPAQSDARADILAGLSAPQAQVAPKYFYDELGSKLFEAITALPEYYPTLAEAAILHAHHAELAQAVGAGSTLIDLGAGNCAKAASLFAALQPAQYVAVDISVEFLRGTLAHLQREHAQIEMLGVGMDFSSELNLPSEINQKNRWFFYPGSSIGNFTPDDALLFLRRIHAACGTELKKQGGLIIGVDLVKNTATLEAAYDDELGVTAAFNLNMLKHLNQLAGTNFAPRDWAHQAVFNLAASRIEMYLVAKKDTWVQQAENKSASAENATCGENSAQKWQRSFKAGEKIHTENSYKYTPEKFSALLQAAGFKAPQLLTDADKKFAVFVAGA